MSTHIVALPEDPDDLDITYLGSGAIDLIFNNVRFRVGNDLEVKRGSLQLTLMAADVDALTQGIGKVVREESRKREP